MKILADFFRMLHRPTLKSLAGIPGPAPTFPFGNALDFLGKLPWEVCAGYAHTYGPVTLIWLGSKPALVLNDPALIGEVLEGRRTDFYKDVPCAALLPILGPSCPFLANDPQWTEKRANHPFNMPDLPAWLRTQAAPLGAALTAGLRRLAASPAAPIDLLEAMQRLSFDAFAVAVWGKVLPEEVYRLFLTLARTGDHRIKLQAGLPCMPPPLSPLFWLARGRWHQRFAALIQEAQQDRAAERTDLIHVLLRQGTPLAGDALRDVMANILFGGVFSVASCLTTTLYLLAHHPDVQHRLRIEASQRVSRDGGIDPAALEGWEYLDCVLRESLRYFSPVPFYSRNVQRRGPVNFAGHVVPANTILFITNWALHRSNAHYSDPDHFDPDRWAASTGLAQRTPWGSDFFFPFGRGPRTCVGMPFALFYLKMALALLAAQVRVEMDLAQPYPQSFFFGVMMPRGLTARFVAC